MIRKALLLCLLPCLLSASSVTIFSGSGFVAPETITPVPAGFGTAAGNYFVPDASQKELFVLPSSGGAPVPFANLDSAFPGTGIGPISGVFVPSGYGALSGDFLLTGNGYAAAVSASGAVTNESFANLVEGDTVAPAGFGSVGGQALLGNNEQNGTADVLDLKPDGATSVFASLNSSTSASVFGMGFAPAGFGAIGGDLLVSDGRSGNIYDIDSSGNVSLFATLTVPTVPANLGTAGLREFAFAPAGYGTYGGDLFVSVSGSQYGGGNLGSVDILNSSGALVGYLEQGSAGSPIDPRGMYFVSNDQLLLADTDPGILSVSPGAFTPVPEPSCAIPLGLAAFGFVAIRAQRRKRLC